MRLKSKTSLQPQIIVKRTKEEVRYSQNEYPKEQEKKHVKRIMQIPISYEQGVI